MNQCEEDEDEVEKQKGDDEDEEEEEEEEVAGWLEAGSKENVKLVEAIEVSATNGNENPMGAAKGRGGLDGRGEGNEKPVSAAEAWVGAKVNPVGLGTSSSSSICWHRRLNLCCISSVRVRPCRTRKSTTPW